MITKIIIATLSLIAIFLVYNCTAPTVVAEPAEDKQDKPAVAVENNPNDLLDKTWTVSYIQELDARFVPSKKAPTISFDDGNRAKIKLSVNSCMGSYKASGQALKIVEEGCTEQCCDDTFDKQLLKLIRANEFSYTLAGNKLMLKATNVTIVLISE